MKFKQEAGAHEPQRNETAPFEVNDIDAELLLTIVHTGGTVTIEGTSGIPYTFRSVPGGNPEKILMVSGGGDMSIIDANKDLKAVYRGHVKWGDKDSQSNTYKYFTKGYEIDAKTGYEKEFKTGDEDKKDVDPIFRVKKTFAYTNESGKEYSIYITKIIVTPGKTVVGEEGAIPSGSERGRSDIGELNTNEILTSILGGGTVEIATKTSNYVFRSIPGGNKNKVVMTRTQDGDIEILDAELDLQNGLHVDQGFVHKKGLDRTDKIKSIIRHPERR